jgi:hypothetical protein
VWGESEVWLIAKSSNKTEDLIQKIKEVMGSFNRDTVAKVCKSLRPRIYRLSLMLTTILINKIILNTVCTSASLFLLQ